MSSTPTLESETENSSSINNISSLIAEHGTTGTAAEDDVDDTSSIEALDWSEADEEELQKQQNLSRNNVSVGIKSFKPKKPYSSLLVPKPKSKPTVKNVEPTSSPSGEGNTLSTSLVESISSDTVSDESSKKSVIENWASDVKDAVDRGEMENQSEEEEIGDDNKSDEANTVNSGCRKRKREAAEGPMTASTISAFTTDSLVDPLSNAPVLDDGPIWNKGPKRYRFQENRRINQKLTFGVLIAVVLAIGLGLGNLVAYNECETEYKASQGQKVDNSLGEAEEHSVTNTPLIDNSVHQHEKPAFAVNMKKDNIRDIPDMSTTTTTPKPEPEEPLDPKVEYAMHMETLSKIVKTLDNLQQKIDKFENNSRHLGGVVMLKDEETKPEDTEEKEDSLYEEEVHTDDEDREPDMWDDLPLPEETEVDEQSMTVEELEMEEAFTLELIEGIEETLNYIRLQRLDKLDKHHRRRPSFFEGDEKPSPELQDSSLTIEATIEVFQQAKEEFIRKERDELRERKVLGLAEERLPKDYSVEEKAEIKRKYDLFMKNYPFKHEVGKRKEELKWEKKHDIRDEDDVMGFMDFDLGMTEEERNAEEEAEIIDFFRTPNSEKLEKVDKNELQIEPKKELMETMQPLKITVPVVKNNKVKGDPEDNQPQPEREHSPSPVQESPKQKRNKRMQRSSSVLKEDLENLDNGSGREYKKPFSNNNNNYDKQYKKKEKKEKKKSKEDKKKKQPKDGSGGGFNEYNENQNIWREFDYDDDDDEHKKKRYSSRVDDRHNHHRQQQENKQKDLNWVHERAKIHGHDSKPQQYQHQQHSSSSKKGNNWQMERDRVREKVRGKNHKNKSYGW